MGYSSSVTWQTDSEIDKYNTWFILCTEALKYLDRPGGVSVDEIKYFFKKRRTHLSDSQISVALIKGLIADIFRTKNGRFFLNKYMKRIFFAETKEKFKLVELKTKTLNKRKKKKRNKKCNRKRKWRQQFDIDEISDNIEDTDEINQNQEMINYGSTVSSDSMRQLLPPFRISSNEDLEEGELLTDSDDETENNKVRMISYPAFYNHIDETKQINFVSSQKRKWLNDTNKHRTKKTRTDNYQLHELDKMSEKYFELNVANKTDKCTPSSWYKENYRKQISDNSMSAELGKIKDEFKKKQDYSLDILSKLKNKDISPRKRWRSDLKDFHQNEMDEDKDENIKPIRKVKILKEKLSEYRSNVTPANGSANGIKYPKSIAQKCLPISHDERMDLQEQINPNNEPTNANLETNRNVNDTNDCLECLKRSKKTKLRNHRRNKEVLEELERIGEEFEKISPGQNVKNSIDNVSNKKVEKSEEKYKVGFALWRYFNPQRPYYEQPVKK